MIDFNKDLYRYYGTKKENIVKRKFRPLEIKYIYWLRKCQNSNNNILKRIYKLKLKRLANKTHISIFPETKIGEGFYIGHTGSVIINPKAILGKNINIATGTVIGQENRGKRKGTPKIGNDVLIAPLSYVNFDVPDHSIVVGNPAKIISKEFATKDYINNKI